MEVKENLSGKIPVPVNALFKDTRWPAIFTFKDHTEALQVMEILKKKINANTNSSTRWGCFNFIKPKEHKEGLLFAVKDGSLHLSRAACEKNAVKMLLNLYEYQYPTLEAAKAAGYLAYRAANLNAYYNFLSGFFGGVTREQRCVTAWNKIIFSETAKPDTYQKINLTVKHFKNIV